MHKKEEIIDKNEDSDLYFLFVYRRLVHQSRSRKIRFSSFLIFLSKFWCGARKCLCWRMLRVFGWRSYSFSFSVSWYEMSRRPRFKPRSKVTHSVRKKSLSRLSDILPLTSSLWSSAAAVWVRPGCGSVLLFRIEGGVQTSSDSSVPRLSTLVAASTEVVITWVTFVNEPVRLMRYCFVNLKESSVLPLSVCFLISVFPWRVDGGCDPLKVSAVTVKRLLDKTIVNQFEMRFTLNNTSL